MATSRAWADFLEDLREATQLLRADPSSVYASRAASEQNAPAPTTSVALTNALMKGCVMLVSGRLQGCIESQVQEFLERVDQRRRHGRPNS